MDSIQAQLQIRQNALEAQEYAQDLLNWQKTLKSNPSSSKQQPQHQPRLPVRGRAPGTVPAAPKGAQQPVRQQQAAAGQQAEPAAHTYKNYSKWDSFDVDAALQAADAPAPHTKRDPIQPQPAAIRGSRDQQQQGMMEPCVPNAPVTPPGSSSSPQAPAANAAALKDQGNKLFQAKYFDDAISCYTQSIDVHPTAVAYANRAMAYLKLDKYAQAEADCTAAITLDPAYIKAWHRRGTARRQLGRLLDAAADFEEGLRLEPSNSSVLADRNQALDQHLAQQQIQRSTVWHSIPVAVQQQQQQQQEQQKQSLQPPASPTGPVQQPQRQQASPVQQEQLSPLGEPTAQAAAVARPVTPSGGSSRSSSSSIPQVSPQQRQSVAAAAQAAAQHLAARLASSLKAPRTGHEFESAWRSLKGDVQLQGKYLALLQPQQLPALFKSSLTAQLVSALLTALLTALTQQPAAGSSGVEAGAPQQLEAAHAVALIEGLVSVPRFDMMAMSLSSRDKAGLRQLWESAVAAVDEGLQQRMGAIKPKYRL